jgi:xylulokinase
VRALGLDVGSTHAKASVVALDGDSMRELAVGERPVAGLSAADLVAATLAAARAALAEAHASSDAPVDVVGVASMAETGALVGPDGVARGALLRWDRAADGDARLDLARGLDARAVHAATGTPLTAKLPLLTWAALAKDGLPDDSRWGFAADLVVAALTGVLATDHTLAGRSGAFRLPPAGAPLDLDWDAGLLAQVGVPATLPPRVRPPGEAVGALRDGILDGVRPGAPVHLAGHDHAVVARLAGLTEPGMVVHSLGTTEAVLALAPEGSPLDRDRAGREGVSVVRGVDGVLEGALAGNPAAGRLIAGWRDRTGGDPAATARATADALALPYPLGRQCPDPDPAARLELLGVPAGDDAAEVSALLRGIAAHGAWMRTLVAELCATTDPRLIAAGLPVRANPRLAGLLAALAGRPVPIVDLAAPAATGAAALAAERAGLAGRGIPPLRVVEPDDDGVPDLAQRFAAALATTPLEGNR